MLIESRNFPQAPEEMEALSQMPGLGKKDFRGDQTRHYNLRTIFIPPVAQGSVSTELFLNWIPLCLGLTMWAYSTHTLSKWKVLMSYSSVLNHAIVISLYLVVELWPLMTLGWGTGL